MSYPNGRIPARALGRIPGNGQLLLGGPAESYRAMYYLAKRKGVDMALWEGSIRRTYRPYSAQVLARQMWCARGNCGNAAVPGTSNHGNGTTVDLMSTAQRRFIDRYGPLFGWSKAWSDASWEWWHIKYQPGHFRPGPPKPKLIVPGFFIWAEWMLGEGRFKGRGRANQKARPKNWVKKVPKRYWVRLQVFKRRRK